MPEIYCYLHLCSSSFRLSSSPESHIGFFRGRYINIVFAPIPCFTASTQVVDLEHHRLELMNIIRTDAKPLTPQTQMYA